MDDQALLSYFKKLDRAFFIDTVYKSCASMDAALPIGHGQTISQPSLVLEMTRLLSPEPGSSVLEIGTGSGYQTALLAKFSGDVYTIERIDTLGLKACERLETLGFTNIHFKIGDGSSGWHEYAPFDRIIVTASAGTVPEALIDQLKNSGKMIVPVGPQNVQDLLLIEKDIVGNVKIRAMMKVVFVEMVGKYGWNDRH